MVHLQARIKCANEVLAKLGPRSMMIPSSQNPAVIAGQGTIATEFLEQVCLFQHLLVDKRFSLL